MGLLLEATRGPRRSAPQRTVTSAVVLPVTLSRSRANTPSAPCGSGSSVNSPPPAAVSQPPPVEAERTNARAPGKHPSSHKRVLLPHRCAEKESSGPATYKSEVTLPTADMLYAIFGEGANEQLESAGEGRGSPLLQSAPRAPARQAHATPAERATHAPRKGPPHTAPLASRGHSRGQPEGENKDTQARQLS